ncbi:hypothetical protein Tco_0195238 [Tanacetum coccineum]
MKTDSSRDPNKVAVPKKKEIQREVDEEQQTNTYSAAERLEQIFNREARTEVDEEQQIQTDRQQTADSEDSDRQIQTADSNSGFRQSSRSNSRFPRRTRQMHSQIYIKLCPRQGLHFPTHSSLQLKAYCDSDWANCPTAKRDKIKAGIILPKFIPSNHQAVDVLTKGLSRAPFHSLGGLEREKHLGAVEEEELRWRSCGGGGGAVEEEGCRGGGAMEEEDGGGGGVVVVGCDKEK